MNDLIVGVLAGATADHLLIDVPLHIALCGKNPRGKVLCESFMKYVPDGGIMKIWDQSTRQCSWCVKKLEKRQRKDS